MRGHEVTRRGFALSLTGALVARAQTPNDLAVLSLTEASSRIRSGTVTSAQLTEACLARIETYNPKLNAFITVMREQALLQARDLDAEQRSGKLRSPLHGIPIALKDNVDTMSVRTTAASAVFDDRVPLQDAEVTRRLKEAGAVLIGKTNLHEFAMGGTSATSYYGPVRNPWSLDRNPGGSIRIPAAFCGVAGLKPTYGLVSIRGIIPLTLSLDHCGPIVRRVEDAALMLNALAGYDKLDIASVEHPKEDYVAAMKQPVSGFRLGIPRAPFFDLLNAEVAKAVEDAIGVLAKMTTGVKDVTLPPVRDIVLAGETNAYHEEFFTSTPERYQIPTRRNLQNNANRKASDYVRARWRLELLRRTIDDSFASVDLVVLPTRRRIPRKIDAAIRRERTDKPLNPELENTGQFNAYGIPAISVPCGFTPAGLPVGLMIAGPRFSEARVLALANAYERAAGWHTRKPPLAPDMPVPALAPTDEDVAEFTASRTP